MNPIQVVVEGTLDGAVASRLIAHFGLEIEQVHVKGGRAKIELKVRDYYRASNYSPWFVLADLDSNCASSLLNRWGIPAADNQFLCRFASREVESWLLADHQGIARTLRIRAALVPENSDDLPDAKLTIVNLARRSPSREIREDMLPPPGSLMQGGPGYNLRLTTFANSDWDVMSASQSSPSLARCLSALDEFARRL